MVVVRYQTVPVIKGRDPLFMSERGFMGTLTVLSENKFSFSSPRVQDLPLNSSTREEAGIMLTHFVGRASFHLVVTTRLASIRN